MWQQQHVVFRETYNKYVIQPQRVFLREGAANSLTVSSSAIKSKVKILLSFIQYALYLLTWFVLIMTLKWRKNTTCFLINTGTWLDLVKYNRCPELMSLGAMHYLQCDVSGWSDRVLSFAHDLWSITAFILRPMAGEEKGKFRTPVPVGWIQMTSRG